MRLTHLRAAGLSDEEAKLYSLLLEGGPQTAGSLLKDAGLKRGTLYQVLRGLEAKDLVAESRKTGKILFSPASPDVLLDRARASKESAARAEAELADALPGLKTTFLAATQKPIFRFYEGLEGLKAVYEQHLTSGQDVWFLRTNQADANFRFLGKWWAHFLRRRAAKGIVAHGLMTDDPNANHDLKIDAIDHVVRTWMRIEDYTAPIEIDVFGDIVAIISFGKEIFGLTMENAAIALSFREMFKLMKAGAESFPIDHGGHVKAASQKK